MPAGRPTDYSEEIALPCIYGLYDHYGVLMYVGKAKNPAKRLKSHMADSFKRNTPLYAWIRKHGLPEMRVIEENCVDWVEAERRIISSSRALGLASLNVADGGDAPHSNRDVRASNGRKNAKSIHSDPNSKRIWRLKKELAELLRRGFVRASTIKRMQERQDIFGGILSR